MNRMRKRLVEVFSLSHVCGLETCSFPHMNGHMRRRRLFSFFAENLPQCINICFLARNNAKIHPVFGHSVTQPVFAHREGTVVYDVLRPAYSTDFSGLFVIISYILDEVEDEGQFAAYIFNHLSRRCLFIPGFGLYRNALFVAFER